MVPIPLSFQSGNGLKSTFEFITNAFERLAVEFHTAFVYFSIRQHKLVEASNWPSKV